MKIIISLFSIVYNFKNEKFSDNNTQRDRGSDNRYSLYEDFETKTKIFENLNKKALLDKLENSNLNNDNKLQLIKTHNFLIDDISDISFFNIKNGGLIDEFSE
uniref:Uncharacterized protein n=1 Tax=viral metagenome TaxID=1070528 RepID=A0A6C0KV29_9ZZZZ